jgi:hypothetical protein
MFVLAGMADPTEALAARLGEWVWAPAIFVAGIVGLGVMYGLLRVGGALRGKWDRPIGQAPLLQWIWAAYVVVWILAAPYPTVFGVLAFVAYSLVLWLAFGSFAGRRTFVWLLIAGVYTLCSGLLLYWASPAGHAIAAAPGLALLVQWLDGRPFAGPGWLRDGWLAVAAVAGVLLLAWPAAATAALWMLLYAAVWSVLGGTFWPSGTVRPFIALTPSFLVVVASGQRSTPLGFVLLFLASAAVRHAWLWQRARRLPKPEAAAA